MQKTKYKTIAKPATRELKIEKSLFIGHAQEASSPEEAQDFINLVRSEHNQATHNCYAYQVGFGKDLAVHFHDHGEPSGTAGKPILGAIQRLELTNTVVVVTRYFGGKKLGIRGLIEAYAAAATFVLESAGSVVKSITKSYQAEVAYSNLESLEYLVEQAGGKIIDPQYGATVVLKLVLPVDKAPELLATVRERQLAAVNPVD